MHQVTDVVGVNSLVEGDRHICMWDFDDQPLEHVVNALLLVQRRYNLPKIHILQTSKGNKYQAFSFTRRPFRAVATIIVDTFYLDWNFYKLGILRDFFTLRTSPKFGYLPRLIKVLPSQCRDECTIKQLQHWTRYETWMAERKLG